MLCCARPDRGKMPKGRDFVVKTDGGDVYLTFERQQMQHYGGGSQHERVHPLT